MTSPRPAPRVLMVCSGNTCRSPTAEALLRRELAASGITGVTVTSAGTGAQEGEPASEGAYLVALEEGLDLGTHRSRRVTPELLAEIDVILAMSRSHLHRLALLGGGDRAMLLTEYAGEEGEVADPYGGALDGYREAFHHLERLARATALRLGEVP